MKTLNDLKAIFPEIMEGFKKVRPTFCVQRFNDDYEWEDLYAWNEYRYLKNGWEITITYKCAVRTSCNFGFLDDDEVFGELDEFEAFHYDEDTAEFSGFSPEECANFIAKIKDYLKDLRDVCVKEKIEHSQMCLVQVAYDR